MVLKYNYFFYPNACHVCKIYGKGISLKRCGNCTMISYCSKEHQKAHWSQHKDLCNAICSLLKTSNILNNEQNVNTKAWSEMKMNFMLLVMMKMGRKLKHYEEEMFKFLRSCTVCHDRNLKALEDCDNCPSASFCTKHKNDTVHKKVCHLTKLCYDLDAISIAHKKETPEIKIPYSTNYTNLPENIKDFIDYYIELQKDPQISLQEDMIINTEYLTRPLTFLYAIQKLEYVLEGSTMNIHIIAANMLDLDGIELWEILLHWIPNIKTWRIYLIGPELSSGVIPINLCDNCQHNKKELLIETHNTLYDTYANKNSYVKPNVIVGYNAGIHECENLRSENETWRESLKIIAKQNCPVILTCYTLVEAEKEQTRLNEILNCNVKCAYFLRNPYSSLRPYRDFETEGIYYQNQYVIIYKHLQALQ
ncbi:uncharacterized protein LOC108627055 [Ceratina calcarata]|uniref:Uncharacterized protein LOC108627055 n=1 Tax=Ceratina calcarata TaxID=156304 RepID=A0AAJ7J465_9HYME|nr:uncharacterized protein LOC108627055 [Ceratina calcarata]